MSPTIPNVHDTDPSLNPPDVQVIGQPGGTENEPWEGEDLGLPDYVNPDAPHPSDIPPPPVPPGPRAA